jgi:hypothetical protein
MAGPGESLLNFWGRGGCRTFECLREGVIYPGVIDDIE